MHTPKTYGPGRHVRALQKYGQVVSPVLAVALGLLLFIAAYKRALDPLFGSVLTEQYLDLVVYSCTALAIIFPKPATRRILLGLTVLVQIAPHSTYWVGIYAARYGGSATGPLVCHILVLAPVVYLSTSLIMCFGVSYHHCFLFLGILAYAGWAKICAAEGNPGLMRNGFEVVNLTREYFSLLFPATFLLFSAIRPPALTAYQEFPYYSIQYPLRILSSQESTTGVIVVGELLDTLKDTVPDALHSLRYLRASHSLLGGVWTGDAVVTMKDIPPRTDELGTPLGDSIYSAFVLQEAVRLINGTSECPDDHCERALVIGVGTGIVADALAQHGISTTLLEVDPAVYYAARRYFGLKHPGDDNVFLEDARGWLERRVATLSASPSNPPKFDMVVHDCFSGGGVPEHLYTIEFWNELRAIMTPSGVVAVNFAGKLGSNSWRAVATTLLKAFGQCRVFHDRLDVIPDQHLQDEFINVVFFCSKSASPLTFRPSVDGDYLHSYLRRHVLSSLERRELPISVLRKPSVLSTKAKDVFLLTDTDNKLNEWQRAAAAEHWRIMRKVMPDTVWETF
ncbi:S-adenosyl-L-methionine-dependent methyltransferase [Pisolithus croceorrhizus]|nr:S-adenosyl-L-methionine-dependent methyltransferase [Pisolithus croceorrhizus]